MLSQRKMVYIGNNSLLRGKIAIVWQEGLQFSIGKVFTQFDDKSLVEQLYGHTIMYGFGKHEFDAKDFVLVNDYEELPGVKKDAI